MDKNSLERRFSLNATRISNPIAESTCLNLNGTSSPTHFQWGGTSISPKNRSNSSICLANNTTSGHMLNGSRSSSASSPQRGGRARGNVSSKIDPRMYADVQSKGLASRIVKYHENGARLSRSMSVNNLYNKPGQFPVVHLKKTELPYKASRQNLSMTRIAPPEKSMFYGNTLSSLLRSNSIVGLHKTDEEISRENRPILHPPPTESELAPTRSVLDVLKEISRKRINSDDLDGKDSNKKYCNREGSGAHEHGLPDTIPPPLPPQVNHLARHLNSAPTAQSYKRQREHIAAPYYPHQLNHHHQHPKQLPATASPSRVQLPQAQHSPEQIAKKRICTYNNDITSSLSSSLKHTNKRKIYDQLRISPNSTHINSSTAAAVALDYEMHKKKMQRSQQQTDLRFEQLSKTLSCNTPITPIPATPLNQTIGGERPTLNSVEAVPPQRTLSEPVYPTVISANKPKLTLFNKNYDTESSSSPSVAERVKDTSAEEGEYAGIQFVKPKKSSSISGTKNPLIERTQKSKLAMMLCGLRGELYQGDEEEDETDAKKMQKTMTTKTTTNIVVTGTVTEPVKATTTPISFNANSLLTPTIAASSGSGLTSSSASLITTTSADTNLKMGNIVGINSLKAKETPDSASTTSTTITTTTPTTITSQTQPINIASTTTPVVSAAALPQLGGFKFTPPSATPTAAVATTTTTFTSITPIKSAGTSPLVGLKLTPPSAAAVPTFSFGSPATSTVSSTTGTPTTTKSAALPVLGGFSFGLPTMGKSSAPPTLTTSTSPVSGSSRFAKSSAPLLVFGGVGGNTAPATTSVAPPSFGSIGLAAGVASSTTATVTPATSVATVAPTFGSLGMGMGMSTPATVAATTTFGSLGMGNSGNATALPSFGNFASSTSSKPLTFGSTPATGSNMEAVKTTSADAAPTFGLPSGVFGTASSSNSFAAPAPAEKTFNFGATPKTATATPSVTSTTTPGGFSFGAAAAATTTQNKPSAAAAPFSFGGSSAAPAAAVTTTGNSAFAAVVTSSSNSFSFGASASTNTNAVTPSFSFGSATQPAPNSASSIFGGALPNTSNAAANPPPAFGSVISATTQPQQTSVFGSAAAATSTNAASTPFAFGGKSANNAPPSGGFAFGASNPPQAPATASTNIFGSSSHSTTNTGIVKPSFSFSGAQTSTSTDASKPSLFGTAATSSNSAAAGSNNNTFGSLAANSNTTQNKTFAFGSNSSSNNNANNIFGAASSSQQSVAPNNSSLKPAAGGFSFGSTSAAPAPAQSMMQNKPTMAAAATPSNAFAFGSPSNNNNHNTNNPQTSNTNTSSPFAFGGSAAAAAGSNTAPKIGTASKAFTFGNSGGGGGGGAANIFGSAIAAVSANAAPTAPGAFNFGGGSMAAPSPIAAVPNGNVFASQMGTMAPGPDRPIRRATRRLQKP